ncbi:unnamed protein product [Aphanomyces euteiches]
MTETSLAKCAHDGDWHAMKSLLCQLDAADVSKSVWQGKSTLHWAAYHGELQIVETLLTRLDVNHQDITHQTALHTATAANKLACVELLLDRGANMDIPDANGLTALHVAESKNHKAIVGLLLHHRAPTDLFNKVRRRSNWAFERNFQRGVAAFDIATNASKGWLEKSNESKDTCYIKLDSTPIDEALDEERPQLSFIRKGDIDQLQEWLNGSPQEIDQLDEKVKTALIHAVVTKQDKLVELILQHEPNVDAIDKTGKTALMYAADSGNHRVVTMLLEQFADIDMEDFEGNTALMIVSDVIKNNADMGVPPWIMCKSLLKKESVYRSSSTEYRQRFQANVENHIRKNGTFNASLFRRAINLHPEMGVLFFNECLVIERHTIGFQNLDAVYGSDVIQSALYHALNPQNIEMQARINKSILSHLVMRRILELKWELFGQRIYLEQFFLYVLLATSMTISTMSIFGTSDSGKTKGLGKLLLVNWVLALATAVSGSIMIQFLRPAWLWSIARYCFDGKWSAYDPTVSLPDLEVYKSRARQCIFLSAVGLMVVLSVAVYTLLYCVGVRDALAPIFLDLNLAVLVVTTIYFLHLEVKEFMGGAGSVRQAWRALWGPQRARDRNQIVLGFKNYFGSIVNIWQLSVYLVILVVYTPCCILYMRNHMHDVYMAVLLVGTLITLSLWLLLVQFLEIHPTAGFLLPMLPSLLTDVSNFALLYAAVQWGFSVAFYVLQSSDNKTFWTIFTEVYFVMFGSSLHFQDKASESEVLDTYRTVLTMVHAAAVVVLLLNLLISMTNTTLGQGLERAKTEAIASYAQCILRMEMSTRKHSTMKLGSAINPAFHETRNKADFAKTEDDDEILRSLEESSKEWLVGMEFLRRDTINHLTQLKQRLREEADTGGVYALERRELEIGDHFALATASNHPSKINVETRFLDLKEIVLRTLDKRIKVDRVQSALVDATMQSIACAFDAQVERSREALRVADNASPEQVHRATFQQLTQLERQITAMRQDMRELKAHISIEDRLRFGAVS